MTTEPRLLTDDELVKVMLDAWAEAPQSERSMMHHILARIRRPLEARGIGLAAEWHGAKAREAMRDSHNTPHLEGAAVHLKRADNHLTREMNLTVLARQHAAGEDAP